MSHGYATANALGALGAGSYTWSSGFTTARTRLNDGVLDELASGSAAAQASGQTLVIDFGVATALVGFALLNHNLAIGAVTVLIEADTGPTFATAVVAKAATTIVTVAPNHKDAVLQFPSVSKRYWRLTFVHSGTKTLTFGEILALASITTLSRTTIYGAGEDERYVQNRNESRTGHVRTTFVGGPVRTKHLPFKDSVGTAQRDELMGMWRAVQGGTANLLWIEFIESTAIASTAAGQECLWGLLEEQLGWTQGDFNLYDVAGLKLVGQGREVGS